MAMPWKAILPILFLLVGVASARKVQLVADVSRATTVGAHLVVEGFAGEHVTVLEEIADDPDTTVEVLDAPLRLRMSVPRVRSSALLSDLAPGRHVVGGGDLADFPKDHAMFNHRILAVISQEESGEMFHAVFELEPLPFEQSLRETRVRVVLGERSPLKPKQVKGVDAYKSAVVNSEQLSASWNFLKDKGEFNKRTFTLISGKAASLKCRECYLKFSGKYTVELTYKEEAKLLTTVDTKFDGHWDGKLLLGMTRKSTKDKSKSGSKDLKMETGRVKLATKVGTLDVKVALKGSLMFTYDYTSSGGKFKQMAFVPTGFPFDLSQSLVQQFESRNVKGYYTDRDEAVTTVPSATLGAGTLLGFDQKADVTGFDVNEPPKFNVRFSFLYEPWVQCSYMSGHKRTSRGVFGPHYEVSMDSENREVSLGNFENILSYVQSVGMEGAYYPDRRSLKLANFWDGHQFNESTYYRIWKRDDEDGKWIDDPLHPTTAAAISLGKDADNPQDKDLSAVGLDLLPGLNTQTYNATFSPSCAGDVDHQYIVKWTAPSEGVYSFNTSGSNFDTVLSIQTLTLHGSELACNDDAGEGLTSELSMYFTAGEARLLIISGWDTEYGTVVLNIGKLSFQATTVHVGPKVNDLGITTNYETLGDAISDMGNIAQGIVSIVLLPGKHYVDKPIEFEDWRSWSGGGEMYDITIRSISAQGFGYGSAEDTFVDCSYLDRAFVLKSGASLALDGIAVQHCMRFNGTGGAILATRAYRLSVVDCVFSGNFASGDYSNARGGAVALLATYDVHFVGTTFEDCRAEVGGAVFIGNGSYAEFMDVQFLRNHAGVGGAVLVGANTASQYSAVGRGAVFSSCEFVQNVAMHGEGLGGAVAAFGSENPLLFLFVNFSSNFATRGGAVYANGGVDLSNCVFSDNRAFGTIASADRLCGGAVALSGKHRASTSSVRNSRFLANSVIGDGAALCVLDGANCTVHDSYFALNEIIPVETYAWGYGAAVFCKGSEFRVYDSHLSGNAYNRRLSRWDNYNMYFDSCTSNWANDASPGSELCTMCATLASNGNCAQITCDDGDPNTNNTCDPFIGCLFLTKAGKNQPILADVQPDTGPMSGGTVVSLTGKYLGENLADVKSIRIAGVACTDFNWVNSTLVTCKTGAATDPGDGQVDFQTWQGGWAVQPDDEEDPVVFTYVSPKRDTALKWISIQGSTWTLVDTPDVMLKAGQPILKATGDPALTRGRTYYKVKVAAGTQMLNVKVQPVNPDAKVLFAENELVNGRQYSIPVGGSSGGVNLRVRSADKSTETVYYFTADKEASSGGVIFGVSVVLALLAVVV